MCARLKFAIKNAEYEILALFFKKKDIDNNEYRENQPWPRVKNSMISNKSNHHLHHHNHNNITINSVVAKKRNNSKKSREIVGGGGGLIIRGSSISGSGATRSSGTTRISQNSQISQKSQHFRRSQNHRTSGASYMAQTVSTTTCTKTLGTVHILRNQF